MHISPEIPQNKKKNGARDQVMEKQTVELLKECNSGCKMGINSMNQVREYVMDEKLAKVLKEYDEKHKKLEKETSKLLAEFGKDEKEPEKIATAFSWISTEMKLMIKDDASQIDHDRWLQHGNQKPYGKDQPVFRCLQGKHIAGKRHCQMRGSFPG